VNPQIPDHFANSPPPVRQFSLGAAGDGFAGRVAIELLDVMLDAPVAEMLDGQIFARSDSQLRPVELDSRMELFAKLEMASLEDSRHRVTWPPAAVLDPLAAEIRLEGDRQSDEFVPAVTNGLTYQASRGLRNSLVGVQEQNPLVLGMGNRNVSGGVE